MLEEKEERRGTGRRHDEDMWKTRTQIRLRHSRVPAVLISFSGLLTCARIDPQRAGVNEATNGRRATRMTKKRVAAQCGGIAHDEPSPFPGSIARLLGKKYYF